MRIDLMIRQVPELWKIDKQFRASLESAAIAVILLIFCSHVGSTSQSSGNYRPPSIPNAPTPVLPQPAAPAPALTRQNLFNVQQQTGTPVVPLGPVAPLTVTPFTTIDKTKLPKPEDDNSDRMNNDGK